MVSASHVVGTSPRSTPSTRRKTERRHLTVVVTALTLLFAIAIPSIAQHLPFTPYSIQDGLSESVVHHIIQDQQGHLWVGTGFGLNRFDGKQFRKYYQQDGLPDNRVNVILESTDGTILVGTQGGLAYLQPSVFGMDPATEHKSRSQNYSSPERLVHALAFTSIDTLRGEIILDLAQGPDHSIWIATQSKGLWKLVRKSRQGQDVGQHRSQHLFEAVPVGVLEETNAGERITALHTTDDGIAGLIDVAGTNVAYSTLWMGTSTGGILTLKDSSKVSIRHIVHSKHEGSGVVGTHIGNGDHPTTGDNPASGIGRINDLTTDQNGTLWAASDRGLIRQTKTGFKFIGLQDGLPVERLHSLITDPSGAIWAGSDNGALQIQPNGSIRQFTTNEGLSAPLVYCIMMDREGNLWMGTLGGGLNKFYGEIFLNYNTDIGLSNNVVTGFEESSDGRIWIATFGGGAQSFKDGVFVSYGPEDGLSDTKLYVIFEDTKRTLWIGGEQGLHFYQNRRFIKPSETQFPYTHVRSVFEDKPTGVYWIGTYYDGIILYKEGVQTVYDRTNVLNNNTVMDIKQHPDGTMWFATYGGAVSYDGKEWEHYTAEDGLPSNGVVQIHIDHEGRVWFSTFEGVAFLNNGNIEVPTGEEQTGIITYFTIQDDAKQYWLGTNRGLYRFQPDRYREAGSEVERIKAFKLYNRNQGLVANELNAGAYLKASDGSLWLGTIEGLSIFRPGAVRENLHPPGIELRNVTVAGSALPWERSGPNPYSYKLSSHLSYVQTSIEFEFAGLSHESPDRILYRYRLEGYDEDWKTTRGTMIGYASLSPGSYRFYVGSFNADGVASTEAVTIDFRVLAPFWMQLWFLVLLVLVVSGLIFLYLRYLSANKQIEIERMRVQIASDLHDDVGSSLTELALQTDFLQHREKDPIIKNTLQKLGEQSRKIVSGLDDIVWSIDSRNDRAGDLTDRMQDYVTHVFKSDSPTVHYTFDRLNMAEKLPVQVKENIYLVFKESIHNIAKHSDANRVEVTFELRGRSFFLMIKDNGSDPALRTGSRKSGQGMRNMELRARRIGAELRTGWSDGFTVEMRGTLR